MKNENSALLAWYVVLTGDEKTLRLIDNFAESNEFIGRVTDKKVRGENLRTYLSTQIKELRSFSDIATGKGISQLEEGSGELIKGGLDYVFKVEYSPFLDKS